MTLTAHEQVAVRDGPDFPRLVVAHGGNYCLLVVEGGRQRGFVDLSEAVAI